ncbi:hypothetical protein FCV25MIE_30148 [Fagus crenata]
MVDQARSAAWVDSHKGFGPSTEAGLSTNPKESNREYEGLGLARELDPRSEPDLDELEDGEVTSSVDLGERSSEVSGVDFVPELTVEEPKAVMDLALVWVDLVEDFRGTVQELESGTLNH